MNSWADPRVYITASLIGLFSFAYVNNPADEAMKGALIAAFAAAYGYWIGASRGGAVAQETATLAMRIAEKSAHADESARASAKGDTL